MTDDKWIRRFHEGAADAPVLVAFPHAGGSAPFYLPMSRALTPRMELLAVQYPGRHYRHSEPPLESVEELADRVHPVLRKKLAGRPFALFGHSLGATIAYEVARRFEDEGVVPLALFASGRTAPSRNRGGTAHLGTDAEIVDRLRELSGTDEQVLANEELLRMVIPSMRSDYKAAETYRHRPGPLLSCPLHVLIGESDSVVDETEARAWAEHTTGESTLDTYRGGHFFLTDHVPAITDSIAHRVTVHT